MIIWWITNNCYDGDKVWFSLLNQGPQGPTGIAGPQGERGERVSCNCVIDRVFVVLHPIDIVSVYDDGFGVCEWYWPLFLQRERLENLEFQDPQGRLDQLWVIIFIYYYIYHLKIDGAFHDFLVKWICTDLKSLLHMWSAI